MRPGPGELFGRWLVAFAILIFCLAFVACYLIQDVLPPGSVPQIFGMIAYFCGPLPILPVLLGTIGIVLIAISPSTDRK